MNSITVTMAIVDFIPVVLFLISAVIIQRDLYARISKGRFGLLAAGSIMVFTGGLFKAAWKLLYALNVCDFVALDTAMFPMQAVGFMLVFLSLAGRDGRPGVNVLTVAPAVYTSNIIFIIFQTLGLAGTQLMLAIRARRLGKPVAIVMFGLSFVFMLGMGYLGARFDDSSNMHWIAQCTNILSQGTLLAGVLMLHGGGLAEK